MPITHAEWNEDKGCSVLYPKKGSPILSQVRGGICFPTALSLQGDDIGGFVVIIGRDSTGVVTVWEEREFVVLDNILAPDLSIKHRGITDFFNTGWSKYFCLYYYWQQPAVMINRYRSEIQRAKLIQPKPAMIEIDGVPDYESYLTISRLLKTNSLKFQAGGHLHRAIRVYRRSDVDSPGGRADKKMITPAIHALHCAIIGLERHAPLK